MKNDFDLLIGRRIKIGSNFVGTARTGLYTIKDISYKSCTHKCEFCITGGYTFRLINEDDESLIRVCISMFYATYL